MFETSLEKYINVHDSLRKFQRLKNITEIEPEVNLIPSKIFFQDSLDPYPDDDFSVLKYEFLSKTPGLNGINAINFFPIEMSKYFKEKFLKEFGYLFI